MSLLNRYVHPRYTSGRGMDLFVSMTSYSSACNPYPLNSATLGSLPVLLFPRNQLVSKYLLNDHLTMISTDGNPTVFYE